MGGVLHGGGARRDVTALACAAQATWGHARLLHTSAPARMGANFFLPGAQLPTLLRLVEGPKGGGSPLVGSSFLPQVTLGPLQRGAPLSSCEGTLGMGLGGSRPGQGWARPGQACGFCTGEP